MSNAIAGYGTLLKRGDGGAPEVFSLVGEVKSIAGPQISVKEADVTTHSSAALGAFMEFIATLIDPGTVDFEINYVPSDVTHQGIRNDMLGRVKRNWKLQLPGNIETISFSAFVQKGPYDFPTADVIKQKVSLRITGAPVWS